MCIENRSKSQCRQRKKFSELIRLQRSQITLKNWTASANALRWYHLQRYGTTALAPTMVERPYYEAAIRQWVWWKVLWNFCCLITMRLPQHCTEYEILYTGDGAGLSALVKAYGI